MARVRLGVGGSSPSVWLPWRSRRWRVFGRAWAVRLPSSGCFALRGGGACSVCRGRVVRPSVGARFSLSSCRRGGASPWSFAVLGSVVSVRFRRRPWRRSGSGSLFCPPDPVIGFANAYSRLLFPPGSPGGSCLRKVCISDGPYDLPCLPTFSCRQGRHEKSPHDRSASPEGSRSILRGCLWQPGPWAPDPILFFSALWSPTSFYRTTTGGSPEQYNGDHKNLTGDLSKNRSGCPVSSHNAGAIGRPGQPNLSC